jgi:deoxyribonuclease V
MLRHRWDISPAEAVRIQQKLRTQVIVRSLDRSPRTVAGLDVHQDRGAVAVFTFPDLKWLTGATARHRVTFPYIPGLLAFREMPALLAAIAKLDVLPDLLLCDGHGIAHPRRFGVACHLGIWVERPTIGCAKSRLCGQHADLPLERGATVPLTDGGDVMGAVVRTRAKVKPVYVSIGHLVDQKDANDVVLRCAPRYRVPEPLRIAHMMAQSGRQPR